MKISCLFGHKWNGCTCSRCGEKRDEGHNWDLCNGRCRICGKEHPVEHDWKGCKCQRCGKTRDEGHDWDLCNGRCRICGKEHPVEHAWNGCKCTRCGKTRNEGHQWKGTKCLRCGKTRALPVAHRDKLADYMVDDRMNYGNWKGEPLVWRVLAVEDDRMLLITEDCLEPRAFNKSGPATWDRCSLREELNGSWFYGSKDVFTDAERAAILPVTNDSPGIYYQNKKTWEECYTNKGSEVEDCVFLLSVTETCQYFHANKNGWLNDAMGYKAFEFPMSEELESEKPWWLRNSTRKGAAAVVVTTWGIINYNGFSVTEAYTPQVRPAMWVSRKEQPVEPKAEPGNEKEGMASPDANEGSSLQAVPELESISSAKVGAHICFGHYRQESDNQPKPIEWRILAKEDERILLISEYALDCQKYNKVWAGITWENSTIRAWLNNEFLNEAFSEEERERIAVVTVNPDKNPKYQNNPGNATQDQVFLLSLPEAEHYFSSDEDRLCKPTDYAVKRGAKRLDPGICAWWLRTPGCRQDSATQVGYGGSIVTVGGSVDFNQNAVRPALWIDSGK